MFRHKLLCVTVLAILGTTITSDAKTVADDNAKAIVQGQGNSIFELLFKKHQTVLTADRMGELLRTAIPGDSFPTLSEIPNTSFLCDNMPGPGFYADVETKCQVFRRCDIRGVMSSFLCTNTTLFNQLTLTCDWWFNVDCSKAKNEYGYANSRLYGEPGTLLFDEPTNKDWQFPNKLQGKPAKQSVGPTNKKPAVGTPQLPKNQDTTASQVLKKSAAALEETTKKKKVAATTMTSQIIEEPVEAALQTTKKKKVAATPTTTTSPQIIEEPVEAVLQTTKKKHRRRHTSTTVKEHIQML